MSTAQRRGASWTNPDGLVVGFGTLSPNRDGSVAKNYGGVGGAKVAAVVFDYKDMNACTTGGTVNVPVPAGSRILDVRVVCSTAWASTGTNTFEVGLTGGDVDGYITTTVGTVGSMTAGAVLYPDGVFTYDDSADGDTTAAELKVFTSADTIDIVTGMSDWTAGTATLVVTYL